MSSENSQSLILVLFGITGNLSRKKILPSLWFLYSRKLLPASWRVIGIGRREMSISQLQKMIREALGPSWNEVSTEDREIFLENINYISGDTQKDELYLELRQELSTESTSNILMYLSTLPALYQTICGQLRFHSCVAKERSGWFRILIEKPFGMDLQSSMQLNQSLHKIADESAIYRVDHYLAKETVQNILAFRFANGVFEHLWNGDFIDHIQVTYAESGGIEGREEFFNQVGIVRDVVQNHILQLLSVVLMDEPQSLVATEIQKQRLDLLGAISVLSDRDVEINCALGQYQPTTLEALVPTAVAMRLTVENERWHGLPVYIRTGKAFPTNVIEANIVFKEPPNRMFASEAQFQTGNVLTIRIQPNEGIALLLHMKAPGLQFSLQPVPMSFCYRSGFASLSLVEAYRKVLFDAINGDTSLFLDANGTDACWRIVEPLLEERLESLPVERYQRETWGPESFEKLIGKDHRSWIEPNLSVCAL